MLSAIAKFFKRVAMWIFSPNYHMHLIDGMPRIVRTIKAIGARPSYMVPVIIDGRRTLLLVKKMPKDESWRVHKAEGSATGNIPYAMLVGKLDGEWCKIIEYCTQIDVTNEALAESFYPSLVRLPNDAWTRLDQESVDMIMKAVIVNRWKRHPDHDLKTIIMTFDYGMMCDPDGIPGLYSSIGGIVVEIDGVGYFAPSITEDYFKSLPVREQYTMELVHNDQPIIYTIGDCPEDWYVLGIDHKKSEITYMCNASFGLRSFVKRAVPGSYVHAMPAEQRKAVLGEWEIPKREVDEIQSMANKSAADLIAPVPDVLDEYEDDDGAFDVGDEEYNEFDELDGTGSAASTVAKDVADVVKINSSSIYVDGDKAWDSLPKHDRPIFYRADLREWRFVVEINDFPLNSEVAYFIPGQYNKDGPIEAIVAFRPTGGGTTIIAPRHYPVVEMVAINNVHDCGDEYKPTEIVVLSRGWRYMFRDSFVPSDCVLSNERLVRNNPTGKPLITFEYVYESGPFVGKVAMRRFVVPSQVLRVGANNKRKAGKRRPGIGKRR